MPYICLTRNDIPDGTIYIKSLRSESQRVPAYDPPGQARYINRVQNETLYLSATGIVSKDVYGLTAYLADCLEPGGLGVSTGTIISNAPVHGDTVTVGGVTFTATENYAAGSVVVEAACAALDTVVINGVTFTAKHAAPLTNVQFLDAQAPNTAITSAASLATQINAHPAVGLIVLANAHATDTVDLTAVTPRGLVGEYTLVGTAGRLTESGATMVCPAVVAASQQFLGVNQAVGGLDANVAISLAATINAAASQLLLQAANGGYTVAAAPVGATNTLTPDVAGELGAFTLVTSAPARITLSDDHLARAFEVWTVAQLRLAAIAIIARMDAAAILNGAWVNAMLNMIAGVSDTSIYSPASLVTIPDLLSVLAGRGYWIPAGATKLKATGAWDMTQYGGFAKPVLVQDSRMLGGEIRPWVIGGDPATKEVKPIRHTYLSDELLVSLDEGEIAVFMAKPGMPPVTLWPRSGLVPQYPWTYQKALLNPKVQVDDAQVIVVYDDDGTILV